MIKCKPYEISFLKPDTCIAIQKNLIDIQKMMDERKQATGKGTVAILNNTPPSAYFKIRKCDGCVPGINRYKMSLEQEKIMGKMKRCSNKHCLQILPADEEHFGKNTASKDGLNYYCKECHRKAAKKSYKKKTG